jgi:hypothetical protein
VLPGEPWDITSLHPDSPDTLLWAMTSRWFCTGGLHHSEKGWSSVKSEGERRIQLSCLLVADC